MQEVSVLPRDSKQHATGWLGFEFEFQVMLELVSLFLYV